MAFSPRPYQMTIIDETREALRRSQAVMINLATGGGKTVIAGYIAGGVASRGKRIWFAAHRDELLSQTSKTFARADIPHGFIAAGYRPQPYEPVQICSIQTLVRRLDRYPAPDILFVDEAKRSVAPTYAKIIQHCLASGSKIIGLDATPWRINGAGFREIPGPGGRPVPLYQEMVKGPPVKWLMDNGWLSRYTAYNPYTPDMSGAHTTAGDWDSHDSEEIMSKPKVTGDIISHWQKLAPGKRTILFEVSVKTSVNRVAAFNAAGIPAMHIDGDTDDDVRRSAARLLATGEIKVLSNVNLLSDGYDLAAAAEMDVSIEAVIQARPTKSFAMHLQQLGRGLRPKDDPCVFLDHAGNIMAMEKMYGCGLPDRPFDWSLDPWDRKAARKKSESDAKIEIRQCSECYHVHPPAPQCPACGYVYPKAGREVMRVDGELVAIDPELLQREKDLSKQFLADDIRRANSVHDLVEIGKRQGYKNPGYWAKMKWAGRQQRRRAAQ